MRLLAEEQKLGTIELLLTSPVRDWEVILGKYVASLVFFLFLLALTSYYVVLLLVFATPDTGANLLGLPGPGAVRHGRAGGRAFSPPR